VPRYELPLTHRPTRDGKQIRVSHVPYYLALEMMAEAWASAIDATCEGVLKPSDLGVVHVTSDFSREVFIGDSVIDVALTKIGVTSLTFHVELAQEGQKAATLTAVLAQVDPTRTYAVPLSDEQREALEGLAKL
jgi:acyl-CoA thioesterase FadM